MSTQSPPPLPPVENGSYKASNGSSTTTQISPSQISASNSTSSQSSWASGTSTIAYGHEQSASNCTSVTKECEDESCSLHGRAGYRVGGPETAEAEFAKFLSETPWMRFQITASPDFAWLKEERFRTLFHRLTQQTAKATSATILADRVRGDINQMLDRLEATGEHINMTAIMEDVYREFVLEAREQAMNAQTLMADHTECGCHHDGGAHHSTCPHGGAPPALPKPELPQEDLTKQPLVAVPAAPFLAPPPPSLTPTPAPNPVSKHPLPNHSVAQPSSQEADKKVAPVGAQTSLILNEVVGSFFVFLYFLFHAHRPRGD